MVTGGILQSHTCIRTEKRSTCIGSSFHTAMDSEVKVVIKKAAWLLQWLKTTGILLATFEREILWVSSGVTRLTLSAPQRKQMAEVGLQQRGSILHIPKKRHD